ncbi:DUF418 domain-containing protein [Brevundimonas sp. SL130]|uniref:DUF418 domain-containing protein n=1 Tax=Brevundimonas sp. SL130 TaxID=2995143 RepID=UPI00226CA728|nr:DUF418 domain-containing protein [Brevundimonas sp. SL130]WAC60196.1 DUF418 domain-containing protein [Brevundimonas sp. SL130]
METQANETPPNQSGALAPVKSEARIVALDIMRGLAVLGILAVNVVSFGMPFMVYSNADLSPFPVTGANAVARWAADVFFHQKFITLFSMLFGASIFLVGGDREDEARGRLLRRRLFWLAIIALIHGLAFWYGDVLLLYAWSGLFVMLMRSMPAGVLIGVGLGVTLFLGAMQAGLAWLMVAGPPEVVEAMKQGQPQDTLEAVQAAIAAYRSGWAGAMGQNLMSWAFLQGASLTMFVFSTVALMMTGLGLFKAGFLSGRAPTWLYLALLAIGGAVLALLGVLEWTEIMAPKDAHPTRGLAEVVASFPIFVTLAYVSLIVLVARKGPSWLAPLRPVGQMAFTNYLSQTLIMTTVFYMPWGPRLFGQVDYVGMWGLVAAVWALQLIWSPLWLSRFSMGPLEWVWRCLTYGRLVPIRKEA